MSLPNQLNITVTELNRRSNAFYPTPENGICVKMINQTGAVSVKGLIVSASDTTENAVKLQASEFDAVGVIYESGVAIGEEMFVVISGIAEVLLENATGSTAENWVQSATTDGRALANQPIPDGNTIQSLGNHFKEIGHCLENKVAGTDVLCKIIVHFN